MLFLAASPQRRECLFSNIWAESTIKWAASGFWGGVWGVWLEKGAPHTEIHAGAPQMAQKTLVPVAVWGGGGEWRCSNLLNPGYNTADSANQLESIQYFVVCVTLHATLVGKSLSPAHQKGLLPAHKAAPATITPAVVCYHRHTTLFASSKEKYHWQTSSVCRGLFYHWQTSCSPTVSFLDFFFKKAQNVLLPIHFLLY
jgi:hypothetical protein